MLKILIITALPFALLNTAQCATLRLQKIASGLEFPVGFETAPGETRRNYVLEQEGKIRILQDGILLKKPFLDISGKTKMSHSERGLLGLAFHPQFSKTKKFYLNYTDLNGDTVISEWRALSNGQADPSSERILLRQKQPFANHNGGQLGFGPDGYLYISLGDGGSKGDPQGNGQNLNTLLGKILRIDVNGAAPYSIPPTNPFANKKDAKPEIWAYGLRNPWRFSFDFPTRRLYIGDVGQDRTEEIDVEELSEGGGKNYGWSVREGDQKYYFSVRKALATFDEPVTTYTLEQGRCSVIGGFVYRGKAIPALTGQYIFGDFCSGDIWTFKYEKNQPVKIQKWTDELKPKGEEFSLSSFGRDSSGEIYVLHYTVGAVYKIVPAQPQ